jgi:[ribosomal protein S18]-alanine N-acetyltransferase
MSGPLSAPPALWSASAADFRLLVKLEQEVFGREAWTPAMISSQLDQPESFLRIASVSDEAAGYVGWRLVADEAEIFTLGVRPAWRRRGLGRLLVTDAVEGAARARAVMIHLEVAEGNGAARACYHMLGFVECGRRRRYYASGEDAILMRRCLGSGIR